MELSMLINRFNIKGRLVALQPFGNGNINDTFLAIYRNTFTETQVILQRVNRNVFPRPQAIMENMHEITKHCHEKLEADARAGRDDRVWQMPRIIKAMQSLLSRVPATAVFLISMVFLPVNPYLFCAA